MHSLHNNFDREGPGGANVYILCLEEFTSVEMLSSDGSSMFRIFPPRTFQKLLFALPHNSKIEPIRFGSEMALGGRHMGKHALGRWR